MAAMTKAKVPDLLGAAGKAQVLAENIQGLQERRFRLETLQTVNGSKLTDPVPTTSSNGNQGTFDSRYKQLDEAMARLVEENASLMGLVTALLEAREAEQTQAQAD
jgi:hypothetical protein